MVAVSRERHVLGRGDPDSPIVHYAIQDNMIVLILQLQMSSPGPSVVRTLALDDAVMIMVGHADMRQVDPSGAGATAGREGRHEDRIGIVDMPASGPRPVMTPSKALKRTRNDHRTLAGRAAG